MPLTTTEIWGFLVHATDDKGQGLRLCQGRFRLDIGKNYSLKEWLNIGMGSPEKWWSHHAGKRSKNQVEVALGGMA